MLLKKNTLLIILIILFCLTCKENSKSEIELPSTQKETLENSYAEGFNIIKTANNTILQINSPWPNSEKTYSYLLLTKNQAMVSTYNKDDYDGIITIPIKSIVVTSTTHIPALELLEVEETLIGFPGTNYVSSKQTRALIDAKKVRELGKNEGINTEVLLDLQPEVVVGFGIDGNNKTFETIKKSGIPVIYNGDWVEKSPLAKAEWIKFFGVLFNKKKKADSVFKTIVNNYNEAKLLAANVNKRPSILCGAMHKDIWYLPSSTSPEAQLLKDANVNYLWQNSEGDGSLALSFESVYNKAKNADIWLSPSYYTSYESLEKASEHYTKFDAFKNKSIYSFSNTTGATGGVTYYELGIARPDLILKDLIKICHPNLLTNYETHFFKSLK
ncbi:ABC transporter substrate-binding protein [Hanstruepera marina]|uniref:ABC transporter substrate-binding protein n=1 Tax=Hanstruepera marina TaxID=2873265 RepID=UPI001CA6591F|nr:ABC transporter substrate-binding protein [Hanstruepera marina]